MSWFGLGGSKDNNSSSSGSSYGSEEYGAASGGSSAFDSTEFSEPSMSSLPSQGSSFADELVAEQQRAIVQAVMFKLTETAFDQCVARPGSSLSSSEVSCVQSVVSKYLDTSEFVVGRMSRGAGQGHH